ncbi:MAG: prepilin-type N-terminal cleavage/methylation domain-containing protein [Peptococcaceae bacterium]|jgi:prepilin-type N-terminal cleavage/methylation domain-containing protein|nr:prepilin-type N-terminal cleavage/methylation domain-containing protein [Peptococcaceae bacterium]
MVKRWFGNDRGFTLVEVMLVSVIMLTVLGAAYMTFTSVDRNSSRERDHALAAEGAGAVVARAASQLTGFATIEMEYSPDAANPTDIEVIPLQPGQTQGNWVVQYDNPSPGASQLTIGGPGSSPVSDYDVTGFSVRALDQANNDPTVYSNEVQIAATVTVNGQTDTASQVVKTVAYELPHPTISVKQLTTPIGGVKKTVLVISGDGVTISFDPSGSWQGNTTIWLNGYDITSDCTQYYPVEGGSPAAALEISNGKLKLLKNNGIFSTDSPDLFKVEQTNVPVPGDDSGSSPPTTTVVAEYEFNYSTGGSGTGGSGGGSGWQPPNGISNFMAYVLGLPGSSDGYLSLGKSFLFYFPLVGGPSYADINNSAAEATGFDYQADAVTGEMRSGRTAGLVFGSPGVSGPVQGGFLYFGVRRYGNGKTYAVFGNWLGSSNPDPSSGTSYTQLAQVRRSAGYQLRVEGGGDRFTFYVDGRPVGQETVSGLDSGDVYTGVWEYPASVPGVIYTRISLTNS